MNKQKIAQEYRDIIFILKDRLHQKQNQYQSLKSQYSSANVFEQTNFDWKVRQKILEVQLEQLNKQQRKHLKDKASAIYNIHFAVLKLMKACDVLSINKEMIFRGADKTMKQVVDSSDFQIYLHDVIKLPFNSIQQIIKSIEKQNKITRLKYQQFLSYFHLRTQDKATNSTVSYSVDKLIQHLVKGKIKLSGLWASDYINAVQFAYQITKEMKQMTVLECMCVYYQLNPLRKPELPKREIVEELSALMQQQISKDKDKRQKSASKKLLIN